MGEDSQKRKATDEEIKQMCEIIEQSMEQGALGVSSSYVDVDENFDPVPSRFSCKKEKIELARAATKNRQGGLASCSLFYRHGNPIKKY